MNKVYISQRKLESYKRAETVCRELRYQISNNKLNMNKITNMMLYWMKITGNIKYSKVNNRK